MRIAVGMFKHETNTFSPVPTRWEDLGPGGPIAGAEGYAQFRQAGYAMAGLLDEAEAMGAQVSVPIVARALPSAPVEAGAFDRVCDTLVAAARDCDAMMLDLHGAMVAEGHEDGEGELLARIRHAAPDLPLAVAYDSHANLSDRMVHLPTVSAGYRTFPHLDMRETGQRAGRMLREVLAGRLVPATAVARAPLLPGLMKGVSASEPMSRVIAEAAAQERDGVACVTAYTGFPLADTADTGLCVVATAHEDRSRAEAAARAVADRAWSLRAEFVDTIEPLEDSIARAAAADAFPVILADLSDNCHSGAPMDSVAVLAAALQAGLDGILAGPVVDPAAVARMAEAGVGATVTLDVGGWSGAPDLAPLRLTGVVRTLGLGRFTVETPVFTGMRVDLGRCAVLETPRATLLVSEGRVEALDPQQFRVLGLEPARFRYILLKGKSNYRPGFMSLARAAVACSGPGVASLDLAALDWRRVRRPIFPLDRSNA